jgi:hypothetical protein
MAVVYRHLREDNLEPFYIGIGAEEARAYSFGKSVRSVFWTRYYKKHGCIVEIVARGLSWEDACVMEKLLITLYGRIDNGTGTLVNMTDGGDGAIGYRHSKETKERISKSKIGNKSKLGYKATPEEIAKRIERNYKHSEESKRKISDTHIGVTFSEDHRKNIGISKMGNKYCVGRVLSDESKEKMRAAKIGKKLSPEHRAKLSEARKRNEQLKKCVNQSEIIF